MADSGSDSEPDQPEAQQQGAAAPRQRRAFSVVKFTKEDSIEAVPTCWLTTDEKECYWPPKGIKTQVSLLIGDQAIPDSQSWSLEPIELLHDYGSIYIARANAKKLEKHDDGLSTEQSDHGTRKKRKIRKPGRFEQSEDDKSQPVVKKRSKQRKRRKLSTDSEAGDSIPAADTVQVEELEKQVQKIVAQRQVLQSKSDKSVRVSSHGKNLVVNYGASTSKSASSIKSSTDPKSSRGSSSSNISESVKQTRPSHSMGSQLNPLPLVSKKTVSNGTLNANKSASSLFDLEGSKTIIRNKVNADSRVESVPSTPIDLSSDTIINDDIPEKGLDENVHDTGFLSSQDNFIGEDSFLDDEPAPTAVVPTSRRLSPPCHKTSSLLAVSAESAQASVELNPSISQIILEKLEVVLKNEKVLLAQQRRLISYVVPEEDLEDADFEELPDFPLHTVEEFSDLEAYLALKTNKKTLVKYLLAVPKDTSDERKATGDMLKDMISNRLSRIISWGSTKGQKLRFDKSRVCSAIKCAILKLLPNSKLRKCEQKIQTWFCTSNQRTVKPNAPATKT